MLSPDEAQVWATVFAGVGLLLTAVSAAFTSWLTWDINGAQTGILYRQQVIDLLDRGLAPEEIRALLHLEKAGNSYEQDYGRIDHIASLVSPPAPDPLP